MVDGYTPKYDVFSLLDIIKDNPIAIFTIMGIIAIAIVLDQIRRRR